MRWLIRPHVEFGRLLTIFAVALASVPPWAFAQQSDPLPTTPPEVRLEAHDGRTQFRLGDPIQLDLVFPISPGAPYSVNTTDYGDLADAVEITPKSGWRRWAGQSAHDYLTTSPLQGPEVRVPLILNQGFVFEDPGHYEIRVTTRRLLSGGSNTSGFGPLTTNTLGIDLNPMPPEDEAALVRTLQTEIASTSADACSLHSAHKDAVNRLASLGGDEALRAKIALILRSDEDMRRVLGQAIASTHNLSLQLTLLQQAWADPTRSPNYDLPGAMQQTRALMRGDTQPGWQMLVPAPDPGDKNVQIVRRDHASDINTLIRSLPARTGQNRTEALYLLMEDGSLSPAQMEIVKPLTIEDFPHMDKLQQHMLLETAGPAIHDAHLAPALRSMLDNDPTDKDAIKDLIRFDPESAKTYVSRAVCDRHGVVPLEAVADFSAETLPEVDGCLSDMLRQPPTPQTRYLWETRASLAARFATPAVLPAVRAGWKDPSQDGPALALLLRYAPTEAVSHLKSTDWQTFNTFFQINKIYDARRAPFPPELSSWLREEVRHGPEKAAGRAAYELSKYGDSSDRALLQTRLAQLRNQWHGKEAEVSKAEWQSDAGTAKQLEVELMSDLRGATLWTETDAEAEELGRGCLSDQCRTYAKPRPAMPPAAR